MHFRYMWAHRVFCVGVKTLRWKCALEADPASAEKSFWLFWKSLLLCARVQEALQGGLCWQRWAASLNRWSNIWCFDALTLQVGSTCVIGVFSFSTFAHSKIQYACLRIHSPSIFKWEEWLGSCRVCWGVGVNVQYWWKSWGLKWVFLLSV